MSSVVDPEEMALAVRRAWSAFEAPPSTQLEGFEWNFGSMAATAFLGFKPVDIDIGSAGFLGCSPLLDIAPPAAAAYLGTYLWALLQGMSLQERVGLFHDVVTRAHVLHCLQEEKFWDEVWPHLPDDCRRALVDSSDCVVANRDLLGLELQESETIERLCQRLR